jgi:hypothetical protein
MVYYDGDEGFVQVAFRASGEMIMLVIGLTLLATSLWSECRIIHGFENDGATPFPIPFFTWYATLVRSLSGSIICSWNVLEYRTRIDVPEVVYFSGEHVRYTLTRSQTLNAT